MQPWLDESFASFTEYVYAEGLGHTKYFEPIMVVDDMPDDDSSDNQNAFYVDRQNYNETLIKNFEKNGLLPINRSYYSYPDEMTYIFSVYDTGKTCLTNIAKELGNESFYGIIREYIQRNAFTNADQMDFFNVLYELAGTDNENLNKIMSAYFDENGQPSKAA
jgi:aminopeptidase N